jgi:sterol desaturase/sphingolipid hydroxylase (fatty acid hydroxylase superfamily)
MDLYIWLTQTLLPELCESFVDPRKRVSIIYLCTAILLVFIWGFTSGLSLKSGLRAVTSGLLSKKILLSKSSMGDYKLLIINHVLFSLKAPLFLSKTAFTSFLFFYLNEVFPAQNSILLATPVILVTVAYTVILFLVDDLSRFITHYALHRFEVLWAFHKIHHSAETLNPLTVFRTHPVEGIIFGLRSVLAQGVVVACFVFFFGSQVDLVSVLGVNVLIFIFNATGANLRHSHVPISYGRSLEIFFLSPVQHQLHHSKSPKHYNCNFGVVLAVWDKALGTHSLDYSQEKLQFGLGDQKCQYNNTLFKMYVYPFCEVSGILKRRTVDFFNKLSRGENSAFQ